MRGQQNPFQRRCPTDAHLHPHFHAARRTPDLLHRNRSRIADLKGTIMQRSPIAISPIAPIQSQETLAPKARWAKWDRGVIFRKPPNNLALFALTFLITLLASPSPRAQAATIDLRSAIVVTPANLSRQELKAVDLLVEEVQKRTLIRWTVAHKWPDESIPVIALGAVSSLDSFAGPFAPQLATLPGAKAKE